MCAPLPLPDVLMLHVTDDDILNGSPGAPAHCAIARALHREGFATVRVRSGRATVLQDGVPIAVYDLGTEGRQFIRLYDQQFVVDPADLCAVRLDGTIGPDGRLTPMSARDLDRFLFPEDTTPYVGAALAWVMVDELVEAVA